MSAVTSVPPGVHGNAAATAAERAVAVIAAVRDRPAARLRLLRDMHEHPGIGGSVRLYRRAALAFTRRQVRRGVLNPAADAAPGSAWWRAVNEALLLVCVEAGCLHAGMPGRASSAATARAVAFLREPSASSWYRAHNTAVVSAYLAHTDLAAQENLAERLLINQTLMRVLYAHALVFAPSLALGRLAPLGRVLGDPRGPATAVFLALPDALPRRYPVRGPAGPSDVRPLGSALPGVGRFLDRVILSRLEALYAWSARELDIPELAGALSEGMPAYALHGAGDQFPAAASR